MSKEMEVEISKRSKYGKPVRQFHGRRFEPEYYSWYSMKTRCGNPNHADYPYWGGKGITYDPAWEDFNAFYADMGSPPGKGYTLERKDGTGNYCKDNCVWLPKRLQNRNLSTTKLNPEKVLAIRAKYANGMTQTELAKEYGLKLGHVGAVVKRKCWKDI